MTVTECLEYLRGISVTPQDEEVEQMLCFYQVYGVKELTPEQVEWYTNRVMKNRGDRG